MLDIQLLTENPLLASGNFGRTEKRTDREIDNLLMTIFICFFSNLPYYLI